MKPSTETQSDLAILGSFLRPIVGFILDVALIGGALFLVVKVVKFIWGALLFLWLA